MNQKAHLYEVPIIIIFYSFHTYNDSRSVCMVMHINAHDLSSSTSMHFNAFFCAPAPAAHHSKAGGYFKFISGLSQALFIKRIECPEAIVCPGAIEIHFVKYSAYVLYNPA